ncbi:MAG: dienelactone hydrolase family protein [Archangium sp.]|nr:dienelactone hydrolase family protein [Archangium sp.]MDP3574261.1 dienelactone hydrolase family protein [Archangium sp.]
MNRALLLSLLSLPALAAMTTRKIPYELDKTKFEGVLVYDDASTSRPGLVLVPNWLGVNEANIKQAELVAARGYVVFVADMYGTTVRPKNQEEAGKAAGAVRGNRPLMRQRVNKALQMLLAARAPLDVKKVGAIGFCFGGTGALELARSGAKVGGVVSFHGGLGSPTPDDAKNITGKVLALHGADDPNVPPEEVTAFQAEMRTAKVDWQLVAFGNAVHSFTDVDANTPGRAQYNPVVAARAYGMMDDFFAEVFKN